MSNTSKQIRKFVKILFFALLALLSGCNGWTSPERAIFEKYHQRLANVLDVPPRELDEASAITIPDKRALYQELPRLSLGLLESYQLRQCGLFNLIAEKNSQLGKVQDPFHDLDYQTTLLNTLNGCLTEYPLSEDERTTLTRLYEQKWQHLPVHLDNVLLTSETMRKQLTASSWLSAKSRNQTAHVSETFHALNAMYETPKGVISRLPSFSFVQYQEEMEKSRLMGKVYFTLNSTSEWLDVTTKLLEENQERIVCGKNRDTTQFRYLRNVFQSIYVEEVQPYLAFVDSTYQQLNDGAILIEQRMELHGESYGVIKAHEQFRTKTLEHVKFWQGLFKRCGVVVGNSPTP
ncbi:hypothetical protein CGI88_19015 [Vibrio parahaemolyticus]|nr:hypothetical protein CGI88_19015 [Vibrio parahaemolyticus]